MTFVQNPKPSSSVHPAVLSLTESQIAQLRLGEWHQPLIDCFTSSSDQREKPWYSNLMEVQPKDPAAQHTCTHTWTGRRYTECKRAHTRTHANTMEQHWPRPHIFSHADGGVAEFYKLSFSSSPHFWVKCEIFFGNTHQSSLLTDDSDCYGWNANWEQTHITENIHSRPLCLFSPSQTHKISSDYNGRRGSMKRQKIYWHRGELRERQKVCSAWTRGSESLQAN